MFNPNLLPTVGTRPVGGEMSMGDAAELRKALTAGYGTDVATLSGGGAIRIQSLEKTMLATIAENRHFRLFNELAKSNATATVDEWTEQSGVGGFLGGSTNTEIGVIPVGQGVYNRRVGLVKYLMTRAVVSYIETVQNNQVDAEAVESQAAAIRLLRDAEFLCFEGDSAVVPTEFDGINAQILSLNSSDHIIDAAGGPLNSIDMIDDGAAVISSDENFGMPTHLFLSQLTQSDFDKNLDPAFRVSLTGQGQEIVKGAPVKGIKTSWGDIANCPDIFIRDVRRLQPFEVYNSAIAVANVAFKPASVAQTSPATAGSKFVTAQAGNYYYGVAGVTAAGESAVTMTTQAAVVAGDGVELVITASAGGTETGYAIYRGKKDGPNAVSDLHFIKRIPKDGATTTWVDLNADIPGTTKAYLLSLGNMAITWRQFLPMTRFPLYATDSPIVTWAQMLCGYLRIGKRRQHIVIKNILPSGSIWTPF